MRLSIIVMIAVLVVGSIVIFFGYMTNQTSETIERSDPYQKLQTYKEELEKINQYNQKLLLELEDKLINSDNSSLNQLNQEISVLKRVINDNKLELEQVIKKLSTMNSPP